MDEMEFEWDDANVEHLARHGISPEEVEELFEGSVAVSPRCSTVMRISPEEVEELFEGPIVRRRGGTDAADRFRVLGRTAGGRYLAIVVQLKEGDVIRPFTGWDMSRQERLLYDRQARY
jgi:uncharacterized DUF497 family protein